MVGPCCFHGYCSELACPHPRHGDATTPLKHQRLAISGKVGKAAPFSKACDKGTMGENLFDEDSEDDEGNDDDAAKNAAVKVKHVRKTILKKRPAPTPKSADEMSSRAKDLLSIYSDGGDVWWVRRAT